MARRSPPAVSPHRSPPEGSAKALPRRGRGVGRVLRIDRGQVLLSLQVNIICGVRVRNDLLQLRVVHPLTIDVQGQLRQRLPRLNHRPDKPIEVLLRGQAGGRDQREWPPRLGRMAQLLKAAHRDQRTLRPSVIKCHLLLHKQVALLSRRKQEAIDILRVAKLILVVLVPQDIIPAGRNIVVGVDRHNQLGRAVILHDQLPVRQLLVLIQAVHHDDVAWLKVQSPQHLPVEGILGRQNPVISKFKCLLTIIEVLRVGQTAILIVEVPGHDEILLRATIVVGAGIVNVGVEVILDQVALVEIEYPVTRLLLGVHHSGLSHHFPTGVLDPLAAIQNLFGKAWGQLLLKFLQAVGCRGDLDVGEEIVQPDDLVVIQTQVARQGLKVISRENIRKDKFGWNPQTFEDLGAVGLGNRLIILC